jgi:RNA polymerase-binding protein DksA
LKIFQRLPENLLSEESSNFWKKIPQKSGGFFIMTGGKKKKSGMEQKFVEKMTKSLSDLKAEIVSNLIASSEDFKEIVEGMDPKDMADIASDDIDRKMIEAIGSQELKRLKLIDSALTRISQGKYGLCVKCGKRIPQDRLEAIPYALMCIDCKTAEERRNR